MKKKIVKIKNKKKKEEFSQGFCIIYIDKQIIAIVNKDLIA